MPVLMTLDLEVPEKAAESRRNFQLTDWDDFKEELAKQLCDIPEPHVLTNETQYKRVVDNLMVAIQAAIEHAVPMSRPSPYS